MAKRQYSYLLAREMNNSPVFCHKNMAHVFAQWSSTTAISAFLSIRSSNYNFFYYINIIHYHLLIWGFHFSKHNFIHDSNQRAIWWKLNYRKVTKWYMFIKATQFKTSFSISEVVILDCTFRNSDGMQIVNLNTASFAGQVKMGLSTIGIHLVATE